MAAQVPPIVIALLRNRDLCAKYDLSSIRFIFTGAAPLGAETHEDVRRAFPGLQIGQVSSFMWNDVECHGSYLPLKTI